MEFIAATNNAHKLKEIERILTRMEHTVISQKQAGITLEPDETGETFAENARIKAEAIFKACGKATIADDSGLCVDALNGAPGVHSARYAGVHGDDEANNDKLLAALDGLPREKRTAYFQSTVFVFLPDGRHFACDGFCHGWVGFARKGTNGFGYDPIFNVPQYGDRSYAELTAEEKDAISHRGSALEKLEIALPEMLADTSLLAASYGEIHTRKKEQNNVDK